MQILKREASNTLQHTELWTVQPDGIGYPFLVFVTTPMTPRPETGWPAVLATDGNMCADTLAQAVGFMGMSSEMPAAVTVTVGYPLDSATPALVARNRELTPVPWPEWDAPYGELLGAPAPPSGSADAVVAFLHENKGRLSVPFLTLGIVLADTRIILAGNCVGSTSV